MNVPRIVSLPKTLLVGQRVTMSIANNRTSELWQNFMPKRNQVLNRSDNNYYSVELYPGEDFFIQFSPTAEFEKWAAVKVNQMTDVPESMETLVIPSGR